MFSTALRSVTRTARTSSSRVVPSTTSSASLPRFSQAARSTVVSRRFSVQVEAEASSASTPAPEPTPTPVAEQETKAEAAESPAPAPTRPAFVRDTSPVLLLLGLNGVSEAQLTEKVKNAGITPTALIFHPPRAASSYLDFPSSEIATQAMKPASALPGITEVVQLFSKKYQDKCTLLLSGRGDVENLKAALGGFSVPSYRIQRAKEAFAVLRFADIEEAAKAQKALTAAGGIGRKIVLKAEAEF